MLKNKIIPEFYKTYIRCESFLILHHYYRNMANKIMFSGLLMLLIISIGLATNTIYAGIDFSDYLIGNESVDDFSVVNYTYANTSYQIILNNENVPILIFEPDETVERGGVIITDNKTITNILTDYYQSMFYPSKDELNQLKDDLDTFNASRNADTYYDAYRKTWHEPEAYCDRVLYLENSDCAPDNEFGCKQLGSMICALYGEGCDPYSLGDAAFEYVSLKSDFDSALNDAYSTVNEIEEGNISDNLDQLKDDISNIKEKAEAYADVKIRLPIEGSSECSDCLGMCPAMSFDYDTLDNMDELIDELINKVQPYSEMDINIQKALNETEYRFKYFTSKELQPVYLQRFNSINNKYPKILEQANKTLSKISNSNLKYYYSNAESLKHTLNDSIMSYNVDSITSQYLNQYESYLLSIKQILNQENLTLSYDRLRSERESVISALIRAKWSVDKGNSQEVEELNRLGDLFNQYENEYNPPMTDAQYDELYGKYKNISIGLNALLETVGEGEGSINKMVYGFSDSTNAQVSGILGLDKSTARAYKVIIPVLVLLAIDIILIILAVFTFMYYTRTRRRFFMKRSVLLSWTILLILFVIIVSIGSIGVYNMMKKTYESTPFSIFESEITGMDNVNILVDYRGASSADASSMDNCYKLVKDSFRAINKTVKEYKITGSSCIAPNGTYSPNECESMAKQGGAMIYLYYSSTDNGYDFSIVPDVVGEFYGNKETFDNCEIGYVFAHKE